MTQLRVTCEHCDEDGVIETPDIALHLSDGRYTYTFICPECGAHNEKTIKSQTVGLLQAVGVPLPAAADDHLVARFAHQLETTDIVAELERLGRT